MATHRYRRSLALPANDATLRGVTRPGARAISGSRRGEVASLTARLLPMLFFGTYLFGSIVVFAFGPACYEVLNPTTLYSYVLLSQAIIALGYWIGIQDRPTTYRGKSSAVKLLQVSILLTLVILPATFSQRNYGDVSLTSALLDPGAVYNARLQSLQGRDEVPIVQICRGLSGPILGLLFPLGAMFLHRLPKTWRILWAVALAGTAAETLMSGTAKGIFDLILILPWLLWLRFGHHEDKQPAPKTNQPITRKRRAKRSPLTKLGVVALTVIILGVGFQYFGYSRQSRYGLSGSDYPPYTTGWSETMYHVPIPPSIEYPLYVVSEYWTHGYVGLSECLDLPFVWGYGIGHSSVLMNYAGAIAGDESYFVERSYPARLEAETGYDSYTHWHTIYPWLASDLTFPGAAICLGLLAWLFARVWSDCLLGANPYAFAFLGQLLLVFYYIPANNVRLMFSEEAITFWGLLFLWLFTRGRRV